MKNARETAAVRPGSHIGWDIGTVLAGGALTAVASQVTVPLAPVPITLQTLAVMICGLTLGARRGAMSQLAYLAAGAAGAPVFAGWSGGPAHLFGPTGGYLAGFVLLAGGLGWAADRGWTRNIPLCGAILLFGSTLQLALGTAWLAAYIGWRAAFAAGFQPFLGLEAIKAILALGVATGFYRLLPDDRSLDSQPQI